jgi:hypothetical protein
VNDHGRLCGRVYKDDIDYSVFSGEWEIGRIYKRRGFPDEVLWVWSLYGVVLTRPPPGIHTDGATATLIRLIVEAPSTLAVSHRRWSGK